MVLFVLEAHRTLYLRGRIDEGAQRIAGQRMVVSAGIHVLKFPRFVVAPLRVRSLKQESFNLVRGIQGVFLILVHLTSKTLKPTANIGAVGRAVFVYHFTENEHLAAAKHIRGSPVK